MPLAWLLGLALLRAAAEPVVVPQADGTLLVAEGPLELSLVRGADGAYRVAQARLDRQEAAVDGEVVRVVSQPDKPPRWEVRLRRLAVGDAAPTSGALQFDEPGRPARAALAAPRPEDEAARRQRLAAMTTAQKVGALLMKPLGPEDLESHADDIASGRLGGALLKWDKFTPDQAREFRARAPNALVAIDHEAGPVFSQRKQATTFPGNMALGAADDTELTRRAAQATARELSGQAHLNFGLVADVNTNPNNPIIGPRSFGQDPRRVSEHVVAALSGYEGSGVVPVVKHFPGHGDTDVDSHTGLPVVNRSLEELERSELAPFRAAVDAGAQSLMTAHILFPALDPEMPATMSKKVIDYLRRKMGFEGALVSDSMDMAAISKKYGAGEASVLAVTAGIDLLLMGKQDHREIHRTLMEAVESGRLSIDRVDEAVLRLMRLKDATSSPLAPPTEPELARHRALADEIAEKAVTLVRDPLGRLPLQVSGKRLFAVVSQNGRYDAEVAEFFAQLGKRHSGVETRTVAFRPEKADVDGALASAAKADVVVVGTYHWGAAEIKEQTGLLRSLGELGKPLVVVSFMSPYDARFAPPQAAVLSVYGLTPPAARAAARVLFGEIPAQGRAPVTIPGGPGAL